MIVEHYDVVFVKRTKDFYPPIKRNSLETFTQNGRVYKVKGKKSERALKDQRNVLGSISLLAQQEGYSMGKLIEYPFTETPPQVSTPAGSPLTDCKSSLATDLTKDIYVNFQFNPT